MSLPFPRCAAALLLLIASLASSPAANAATANAAPIPIGPASAASQATVQPLLPSAAKNTGAAVLIVTAGGAPDAESRPMPSWLGARGIASFVLQQPGAPTAAAVSRAVQYLRANAATFKISPQRIAVLGFGRGAELAAEAGYAAAEPNAAATDPVEKVSARPDLLGLIWGASASAAVPAGAPPTFLVASTHAADNMGGAIELWNKLRAARVSVDAHFFAKADANSGFADGNTTPESWPEMFHVWTRYKGLLTDGTRVPVKGMVYLDGKTLPHGYVILTPVDFVGAGPIVGRVFNSTANEPLGLFSVSAAQGPIPGRYKVDVRQNMNRWISNAFTGGLTGGRGGNVSPAAAYFGHHRALNPTIDDQRSFTKVRPGDREDYIIEIKPGADANLDLKLEVFSK